MEVRALGKPSKFRCPHLTSTGCGIYAERPQECALFVCLWLADPGIVFRESERPDLLGVLYAPLSPDVVGLFQLQPLGARSARSTTRRILKRIPVQDCG